MNKEYIKALQVIRDAYTDYCEMCAENCCTPNSFEIWFFSEIKANQSQFLKG